MARLVIIAVLVFLLSAAGSAYAYLMLPRHELRVFDQPVGTTITIQRLVLSRPAFIRLRTVSFEDQGVHDVVSDYLPVGVYADFNVDIIGAELTEPKPGAQVIVDILNDNGDAYYDSRLDMPAKGWYGKTFSQKITLL